MRPKRGITTGFKKAEKNSDIRNQQNPGWMIKRFGLKYMMPE